MRYPGSLRRGGTIGFVAPSFGCAIQPYRDSFDASLSRWRNRGYEVKLGPNCYLSDGIGISSTPQNCATELMDYYCSSDTDVLISCGGGELMCEILPYLDFDKIAQADPKWYMGYSDNTNFTFTLATMCDVASIYGPCGSSFGTKDIHPSLEDAVRIFTGDGIQTDADEALSFAFSGYGMWEKEKLRDAEHPFEGINATEKSIIKSFEYDEMLGKHIPAKEAHMQGRLIGGCLDCLVNLCGTKFDHVSQFNDKYASEGIIWFLEACDLNVMSIRRAMWELENAGWFERAAGFVIGRPLCFGEEMMGLDQYLAVLDVIASHKVPVLMDVDLGHLPPMVPVVCGSYVAVCSQADNWKINMKLI